MSVQFTLSLVDKVTAPAKSVANAFTLAAGQSSVLQKAMAGLETQATKAAALGDIGKFKALQKQYAALTAQVGLLEQSFPGATGELARQAAAATAAAKALKQFEQDAKTAADAEEAIRSELAGGALGFLKFGAAAAVGFAAAVAGGAYLAIQATETRKKLEATFQALTGSDAVVDQIDGLTSKLGMTREVLAPLAEQILGMGVPLSQLQGHLTALATVTAVGITGGTEVYLNVLKKLSAQTKVSSKDLANLYKTGVNVDEIAGKMGMSVKALQAGLKAGTVDANQFRSALTDAVTAKGASALANQAQSFSAQMAIAKEQALDLFSGIDTSPLLGSMKGFVGLLDQANPSGQALKAGITGAFDAIFSVAGKVVAFLKTSFLRLIVLGLQFYILVKQHQTLFQGLAAVLAGVVAGAFIGLIALTWSLVAAAGSLAVAVVAATWPFLAIGAAIGLIGFAFVELVKHWDQVKAFFVGIATAAWDLAGSFIDGLVGGIEKGASRALDAVKNLGKDMLNGVKNVLGIHSPSAEMMKLGVFTATGFAQGIGAANDNVIAASSGMAASATSGAAAGAGGGGGTAGGLSITIEKGAIVIQGAGSPEATQALLESTLATLLERVALTQGIATAA